MRGHTRDADLRSHAVADADGSCFEASCTKRRCVLHDTENCGAGAQRRDRSPAQRRRHRRPGSRRSLMQARAPASSSVEGLPYWRIAGAYFFYFAYLGAFAPYFSLYLSSLGIASAGIGVIMSLPQLVRIFAPHLWGWLADRSGHRLRVARIASVIGTAAYCLLFAVDGLE